MRAVFRGTANGEIRCDGSDYSGRPVGHRQAMAVMMVAGNRAVIPDSLLKGVRTLTSNIVLEMGYATDLHRGADRHSVAVRFHP